MSKVKAPWVVAGGKEGELGHCTRCGEGLNLGLSQPIPIAIAAVKAFTKIHANCVDTGRLAGTQFLIKCDGFDLRLYHGGEK